MGCNCKKNKRQPLSAKGITTTTTTQPRMRGVVQSFTLNSKDGARQFSTRLEAEAAKRRFGGTLS